MNRQHPQVPGPQVVVDSFAESRQKDLLHLAEELEHENEQDKKHLETCHLTGKWMVQENNGRW